MKLSRITVAVATLAASCAASAAAPLATEIAYTAGASAVQANFQAALADICNDTTGYQLSKLRANLLNINDNFVAYVCATAPVTAANYATATYKNFSAGIPFKEIRMNVDQGSFSAILQVQDAPFPVFNLSYFDPAGPNTASNITPNPTTITRLGGVLDVQPEAFDPNLLLGLNVPFTSPLGFAQAFGVAVSQPLYVAMYNNQLAAGSATVSKPIPSTCGAGNALTTTDKIECIPTVSKGQMAAIMADNPTNAPNSVGAAFLGGAAVAGVELGYARRVDTSGTQAAAQNYFLGNVCSNVKLAVVGQGAGLTGTLNGPKLRVYGLGSTGNVRTILNDITKLSIGVVSGENNQTGQTWKWVKVQGAPLGENASPSIVGITNSDSVKNGNYDFYYEAVFASYPSATAANFWTEVQGKLNGLPALVGVGLIDDDALLAGFNKGGNTCQFNSSN